MSKFIFPLTLPEDDSSQVRGSLELDDPLPFNYKSKESGFYRPGKIVLEEGNSLELVLYHSAATASFIYLRRQPIDTNLMEIIGLGREEYARETSLVMPGQLCLGAERSKVIGQAIDDIFSAPPLKNTIASFGQQNLAVFPIAREGLKYQVAEALVGNYGFYCDEILLDAHHVFDISVPVYNRKVELGLFKDKDLDKTQREKISVAFIADSIASGLVMKEVISRVKERFERLQNVEVVAPLATIRGLCRLARCDCARQNHLRVHVFETLLNALPPDYYYSAHFDVPELHICPDLEREYRHWWGKDPRGTMIADTACAGYGWSEAFFSPRKQIEMMNGELGSRHGISITDIIRGKIR
jgi:hypothetical protein